MAKLSFSKLKLKMSEEVVNINFNEQTIEVKKYLPINQKLEMVGNVLTLAADENRFWNIGKLNLFFTLEVIQYYTNITFTEKQLDDPCKLYDLVKNTGLYSEIDRVISDDVDYAYSMLKETVEAVYAYNNSVMGILDTISQDYSNLNFDASDIQQKLADPNNLALLKDIVGKLG
jgi:hypothetical protein